MPFFGRCSRSASAAWGAGHLCESLVEPVTDILLLRRACRQTSGRSRKMEGSAASLENNFAAAKMARMFFAVAKMAKMGKMAKINLILPILLISPFLPRQEQILCETAWWRKRRNRENGENGKHGEHGIMIFLPLAVFAEARFTRRSRHFGGNAPHFPVSNRATTTAEVSLPVSMFPGLFKECPHDGPGGPSFSCDRFKKVMNTAF